MCPAAGTPAPRRHGEASEWLPDERLRSSGRAPRPSPRQSHRRRVRPVGSSRDSRLNTCLFVRRSGRTKRISPSGRLSVCEPSPSGSRLRATSSTTSRRSFARDVPWRVRVWLPTGLRPSIRRCCDRSRYRFRTAARCRFSFGCRPATTPRERGRCFSPCTVGPPAASRVRCAGRSACSRSGSSPRPTPAGSSSRPR